ncbi:hypothetical protein [Cohnella sp. GCM10027633]|uniref:hypothetical protein n=1 Tax=unclassified Cohnella TaxID=2636738 RepID=UPI0036417A12
MATVSSSLKSYRALSEVLLRVGKRMDLIEAAAKRLKRSVESPIRLKVDTSGLDSAMAGVQSLAGQVAGLQENIGQQMGASGSAAGGLLDTMKNIASTVFSMDNVKSLLGSTLGGAMEQQKLLDAFIARTGDAQVGQALFAKIKAEALTAGQDVNEAMKNTLSFMGNTNNTDQLSQLNEMASRMAAFDMSGGGIADAAAALKAAMSGDTGDLASQYNMSQPEIDASNIQKLAEAGDMEGFLQAFDTLLEKQNMGKQAFDQMMATPANQVDQLGNRFQSVMADAGMGALQAIAPLIASVNAAFASGQFQPFFDTLGEGLSLAATGFAALGDIMLQVAEFFSSNWSIIEPIIWGIVAAVGVYLLLTQGLAIATAVVTAAQAIWNAVMNLNPIILIITLVAGLIVWLFKLWESNDAFAAGLMSAWNGLLNFFDQVPIFFAMIGFGIVNVFQSALVLTLKVVEKMINGVIDGVNWAINALNKIPGVNIQAVGQVNFSSGAEANAAAIKQANAAALKDMRAEAASKAKERAQKSDDMLAERQAARNAKSAQNNPNTDQILADYNRANALSTPPAALSAVNAGDQALNVERVGEVGKVNSTVEISSEDLKVIRDLAEIQSIQNFVTLTPTVSVTTGPVSKEVDVDDVIMKIGARVSQEIESSAGGVYAGF